MNCGIAKPVNMSRSGNNVIDNISGSQQESTERLVSTTSNTLSSTVVNVDISHNLQGKVNNTTTDTTIVDAASQSLLPLTERAKNIVGQCVNDASQVTNDDIKQSTLENLSIDKINDRKFSPVDVNKSQDRFIDDFKQTVSRKYLIEESSSSDFSKELQANNCTMSATMTTTTSLSAPTTTRQAKPVATSTYSWRLNSGIMERTVLKKNCSSFGMSGVSSISASTSPSMLRKGSLSCGGAGGSGGSLPRRVSFPKSDSELVTGYLEPANPWENGIIQLFSL